RVRDLAPGAHRRPAPGGRRGRRRARPRRPARRPHRVPNLRRPLRRVRVDRRPPVVLGCAPRLGAKRRRAERDPGARLRADLREAARARPRVDRALAGGDGGGRASDGRRAPHAGGLKTASLRYFSVSQVLVLNASYEPLNVCSVRRAHVLVYKGKAEVLERLERPLRSASDTYTWPHVIRLVTYVHVPRTAQRKISRRALFARDNWCCVYCGTSGGRLTLDHVVPRSRGGES